MLAGHMDFHIALPSLGVEDCFRFVTMWPVVVNERRPPESKFLIHTPKGVRTTKGLVHILKNIELCFLTSKRKYYA